MSSSDSKASPVTFHLPVEAEAKEEEIGQKKKVHKFWHLRRQKRKTRSLPSTGEQLRPTEPLDQDSSASEFDDSDYKEQDQDEHKLGGYERDEEEDSLLVSL